MGNLTHRLTFATGFLRDEVSDNDRKFTIRNKSTSKLTMATVRW